MEKNRKKLAKTVLTEDDVPQVKPPETDMKQYIVVRLRIDTAFNEHNNTIWQGEAENEHDAVQKAVDANYEPKDRNFMKGYLTAHALLN